MNTRLVAGGVIAVVLFGALAYLGPFEARRDEAPVSAAPGAATAASPASPASPAPPAASMRRAPVAPPAIEMSAKDLETVRRYAAWSAQTPEEARWLEQHGYPDEATAERYAQLSDDALGALAANGDPMAKLQQAERAAYRSQDRQAIDDMFDVAADGSIYALERLALAQASGRQGDTGMAEAYLQAARLRGNYAAPVLLGAQSTPEERAMSHAMAQAILDRMNQMRSQRGLPPLGNDPRPGAGVTFEQLFIEWQSRLAAPPSP